MRRLLSPTSYTLPAIVSVGLHAVLLVFVFWGWRASSDEKRVVVPRYIEAKIVRMEAAAPKAAPPKPQPKVVDVAARREEAERQRREAEARRQAEQLRQQQAEKQQAEKQRKEQARKEKERQERERQAEEQRLAEQRQKEQRQQEQRQMQQALAEELEAERSRLQAREHASLAQSYKALIHDRIKSHWSLPPSARNEMKCEVSIQLVPTGRVVGVTIVKRSGNDVFDRSAEQAVWKAEQFPELQQVPSTVFEQYFRKVTLVFRPEDLRQ